MSDAHSPSETDHNGEAQKYHAFINLALALAAITGVELVLVYLPINQAVIFTVLIALSLFKFISVIAWFMHLIYDRLLLTLKSQILTIRSSGGAEANLARSNSLRLARLPTNSGGLVRYHTYSATKSPNFC